MASKTYLLLMILLSNLFAQVKIGDWKAYTSPLKINNSIISGDSIICATSGGLFINRGFSYKTLTTIDGLYGVDLSIIEKDKYGNFWLGGSAPFGFIQIYNFNKGSVEVFDFGLTEITDIYIDGEYAFAAFIDGQDVGIVKLIYSNDKWSYRDIYRNFPIAIEKISGIKMLQTTLSLEKNIFLATNMGLFLGDISKNLKDPNNWERGLCCFENAPIKAMTRYQQGIAFIFNAADDDSAKIYYIYPNEEFYLFEDLDISLPIEFDEMIFDNEYYLVGIKNKNIYSQRNGFYPIIQLFELNDLVLGLNQEVIISSDLGLIFLKDDLEVLSFIPNAPASSKFTAIEILDDGRLVAGHNYGLSIKDYNGWRNILELKLDESENINETYDYSKFIADTIAFDFGEKISDIEQGPDGLLYVGIDGTYPKFNNPTRDGGGILIIDVDDPQNFTSIDTSILGFYGSSGSGYHVVKDLEFDSFGNLWVANAFATNKNSPIVVRNSDGIWKIYGSSETTNRISQSPISLAFDNWSRPWFGAFKAEEANLGVYPNGGIFVLDYDGSATQPSSFFWESIIYNTTIWSIGFSGSRLYYLTTSGLNYFDIINGQNPIVGENSFPYFPNVSFSGGSKVKIDKQGNIWTSSTTQGIHVLLENTTYWPTINGLRQSNSPLLSDDVYDIDFDEERKLAYIATSKGISVLKIPFGESYDGYSMVKIFPSPFRINKHDFLIVDGLPFNASMKVMTLDGIVIREIKSNGLSIDGDQLKWDGKNDSGEYVASGVYLLSIIGSNGKNTYEKITVLRN